MTAGEHHDRDLYVVEHVREALATDRRTSVQGLTVSCDGDDIVVAGTVTSEARREAVAEVVADVASPCRVVNAVVVLAHTDGHEAEELP